MYKSAIFGEICNKSFHPVNGKVRKFCPKFFKKAKIPLKIYKKSIKQAIINIQ